ncbi:hypothetical protein MC885_007362 [Smutsia gigantea]|nr:hypothetical protein MC885_007362 [Smutsia gigantea]
MLRSARRGSACPSADPAAPAPRAGAEPAASRPRLPPPPPPARRFPPPPPPPPPLPFLEGKAAASLSAPHPGLADSPEGGC